MPVIVAQGLHKAYAGFSPVLRGVDISVEQGELVAIMGPSGCGKSTMLHILGMLHAPDKGTLSILDTDVLAMNREQVAAFRRGNMGFVMQSNNLFEHSTVFENVEFPLIYERVSLEERWERVIRALDLVHLSSRVHYRSNRLSGGEQQRVAIARAMVNAPRILLADEPTGALDARTSRMIMEIFRNLCHASGVAMVMVTHDPKMADFCDSVYTLEEGVLVCKKHEPHVFAKPTEDLLKPPVPVVRGAYIAEKLPVPYGTSVVAEARFLYEQRVLARIYTVERASLLSNPEGYALPLAIRRPSTLSRLTNLFRILSPTFWRCMGMLAGSFGDRARAVFSGMDFAKWIAEEDIAVIWAADGECSAQAALVASNLSGVPFGFDARFTQASKAGDLATKSSQAAFIRVPTHAMKRRLLDLMPLLSQEKLLYMRDPVTLLPQDDAERLPMDASDHVLTIVAAGRMQPHKGFDILLEACAALQDTMQVMVKIAGDGPELAKLKQQAKSLGGLHMVSFLGQLPPEHMESLYTQADIFVSLERISVNAFCDAFPDSLSEAMAFSLPVIVTDLPVVQELLVHEKNALLIPPDDVNALIDAIKRLGQDPSFAHALGLAAKKTVEDQLMDATRQGQFVAAITAQAKQKKASANNTEGALAE